MDLKEALDPGAVDVVRHPWELARYRVVRDLLKQHSAITASQNLRILDMGCGDSWFVEQLAKDFPQHHYTGVDIAFTAAHLERLNSRLETKPICLFPALKEAVKDLVPQADIVLLLDVIEHIEDEISFLKWMQTFAEISPQTTFFITVPAYQSLFCEHDVFLEHYRRYTQKTMHARLSEAGLSISKQGYFFASLLGPRILQVLSQRIKPAKEEDETGVGQWSRGTSATNAFTQVLWQDYRIGKGLRRLGLNPPGLSHFAIARPHA